MPTLSEYFRTEARDFLSTLDRIVAGGRPDASALHRAARGLRGSAQMAREERFFRAVSAFENITRSVASGALGWSEDMTERARATIAAGRMKLRSGPSSGWPVSAGPRKGSACGPGRPRRSP